MFLSETKKYTYIHFPLRVSEKASTSLEETKKYKVRRTYGASMEL